MFPRVRTDSWVYLGDVGNIEEHEMKVMLKKKQVYGVDKYYPANRAAELFVKLSDKKTVSVHWLPVIRELGFVVELIKEELPSE